ncbi:DUF3761 domain-containing protein [Longimicrobium sp.]|uniref:DUF3761 domain-containing protein n=1 Tax=Longimicrobium sp. TaxID=2029185 RepID=UPI0039C94BDD
MGGPRIGFVHLPTTRLTSSSPSADDNDRPRSARSSTDGERPRSRRRSERSAPSGATARCRDGTPSFSTHRRGTCSHHGGVAEWY